MTNKNLVRILTILFILPTTVAVYAQQGLSFDLPKPKKFENRKLASEKSGDRKFTVPRKFMQNTTTHYNYFFNADEKIKEVVARAKADHKDDYTQLLPFYNYSFEETGRYKTELDSVIYKATAGILLHDLRTNWVDNLYLLIGNAYYLKKDFDSAYLTFQYLNYAFSPKEKDGYDKVIGSNANEGGSAFSISTNEKRNIVKQTLSRPPSRNESLLWQVKTYIAADELPEAAGLIQTLKYDPLFPSRLKTDLEEAQAWYFYKQSVYDSAAIYLELALDNATNKQETARWEYLIAQLFEKSGKHDLARDFYDRVIKHTIDPVLEVYALLNSIRQSKGNDEKAVTDAIHDLTKMARKDKYINFRDIIYYTAAEIETDDKKDDTAKIFLQKSIKYNIDNPQQKSRSFFALANIEFEQKDFINAKNHYDSVSDMSIIAPEDQNAFIRRKDALAGIALQQGIINRQDSLQRIAAMPQATRESYIKKLLRQLRKQQGLKEDDTSFGNTVAFADNNNVPVDLFNTDAKADWYFSNANLKSRGFGDFKAKWGNRSNVDNWQRSAAIKQQSAAVKLNNNQPSLTEAQAADASKPLTITTLTDNLPLTPEKLKISNDSIMYARFELGKALQDELEDYNAAIEVYERLLQQFPDSPVEQQTLFNLYYCYKKTGDAQKTQQTKNSMEAKFGNSKLTEIVKNPQAADEQHKKGGAQLYDEVYNLFIEGRFAEAMTRKAAADTLYGKHYWSPQLLYIESVYHINQRNDSAAKAVLANIITLYPGTAMAAKAQNLIDVLARRKQIEDYLTKLEIKSPAEQDSIEAAGKITDNLPPAQNNPPDAQPQKLTANKPIKPASDTLHAAKKAVTPAAPVSAFSNTPDKPHFVALVMDKVDPVYIGEAKNAFNRYNKEKYYNKPIDIIPLALTDDIRLILFSQFENAAAALDYLDKSRKLAPSEIIPWMAAGKYSFIIITEQNLEILKMGKDIPAYRKFIQQNFPGIF
jgi:outer membrane protein assembly factor BamD (BamD/ComL family)